MIGEFFDPERKLHIEEHLRPHWSQAGAIVFVTFRTKDSIPKEVLKGWDAEKLNWLKQRHLLGEHTHWVKALPDLTEKLQREFNRVFNRTREGYLDSCHGKCVLKRPELAQIVADSLLHFDKERYRMGDFVIMPNHVHLLAVFPDPKQ